MLIACTLFAYLFNHYFFVISMYLYALFFIVSTITAHEIFFEENSAYPVKVGVEISKHLESVQSPFMKIDMYETTQCGNMLVLDGAIQLTQWDNSAYNEMLAHVPLMTHPNPKRVLIIGGGDGGTLTEVIKYPCIEEIILCEIDAKVIELSQKYFPEFAHSFTDRRVTVVIEDGGGSFIKQFKNHFDVIIVDASDPEGPATVLYTQAFYEDLKNALTDDGIVVAQAESPFFHADLIKQWHARNKKLFPYAGYYFTLVPTYPSGVIGFTYCSKKYHQNHYPHERSAPSGLRYYTPMIHSASFTLPAFLADHLK